MYVCKNSVPKTFLFLIRHETAGVERNPCWPMISLPICKEIKVLLRILALEHQFKVEKETKLHSMVSAHKRYFCFQLYTSKRGVVKFTMGVLGCIF